MSRSGLRAISCMRSLTWTVTEPDAPFDLPTGVGEDASDRLRVALVQVAFIEIGRAAAVDHQRPCPHRHLAAVPAALDWLKIRPNWRSVMLGLWTSTLPPEGPFRVLVLIRLRSSVRLSVATMRTAPGCLLASPPTTLRIWLRPSEVDRLRHDVIAPALPPASFVVLVVIVASVSSFSWPVVSHRHVGRVAPSRPSSRRFCRS